MLRQDLNAVSFADGAEVALKIHAANLIQLANQQRLFAQILKTKSNSNILMI